MSQLVKVKVRANKPLHFPAICTNCAQPASSGRLGLKKRIGRVTRTIDVPLCHTCHDQLRHLSSEERRLQKLNQIAGAVTGLFVFAIAMLLTPAALALFLRLLISLFLALLLTSVVFLLFRKTRSSAAPEDKKAIYESAHILAFSWRATTFEFSNETFLDRFRILNESLLMDA